jgi:hypothetical protein
LYIVTTLAIVLYGHYYRSYATIDMYTIIIASIIVAVQYAAIVYSSSSRRKVHEQYEDDIIRPFDTTAGNSALVVTEDLEDPNLPNMPDGMVMYISCFLSSSYGGSGKQFKNVAITDTFPAPDQDKNVYFRVDPAFSRKDGFSMSANSITGPLSYKLDIKGDLNFTTVCVCQFTGVTSGSADIILQRIYANTPDNNGFCIFMNNMQTLSGNNISVDMFVTFGTSTPFRCSQTAEPSSILLDTNKKYMIVASKGMGRLKVRLVDVGIRTTYDSQIILDAKLTAKESVVFSNKEMMINNNENWNANIMTYSLFDRVLADTDTHVLYTHYNDVFRKMDPEYKSLLNSIKDINAAKSCPYDVVTCAACASISDFTDPKKIIASSDKCLSSINAYCLANPGHSTCWCWDSKNPYYNTRCKSYRSLFAEEKKIVAPAIVPKKAVSASVKPVPVKKAAVASADVDSATTLGGITSGDPDSLLKLLGIFATSTSGSVPLDLCPSTYAYTPSDQAIAIAPSKGPWSFLRWFFGFDQDEV